MDRGRFAHPIVEANHGVLALGHADHRARHRPVDGEKVSNANTDLQWASLQHQIDPTAPVASSSLKVPANGGAPAPDRVVQMPVHPASAAIVAANRKPRRVSLAHSLRGS